MSEFLPYSEQKNIIITDGTVTVENNALVYSDFNFRFTNSDIHSESFELIERLCSSEDLDFGDTTSSEMKFTFSGNAISLADLEGNRVTLNVYFYFDNDVTTLFKVGTYKVLSDKPTADRTKREIEAYDVLYDIINADVVTWWNGLTFPITAKNMLNSFMSHFNVTVDYPDTLINENVSIKKNVTPQKLSGKDVLHSLLEIFGCFGRIGRNGHFQLVYLEQSIMGLYPKITLYPSNDLYPRQPKGTSISESEYIPPCKYEDYMVQSIDKLEILKEDGTVGDTVGSGDNLYTMTGNFLLYDKTSSQLATIGSAILGKISELVYRPFETDAVGNLNINCGDAVMLSTTTQLIESYLVERHFKGIQAVRDTFISSGSFKREKDVNSIVSQLQQLNGTTHVLKNTSDELSSEITNLDSRESSHFSQTSSAISLKVSKGDVSSEISLENGQVTLSGNRLVVNSTNFQLDANGDATFSGNVTGATITGGTITQGTSTSDSYVNLSNGELSLGVLNGEHALLRGKKIELYKTSGNGDFTRVDSDGFSIRYGNSQSSTSTTYLTKTDGAINGKTILTTASAISGSQISGKVSSASSADIASGVSSHSVSSRDGLTASNSYEVVDQCIYIGGTWRATSVAYCDANYQPKSSDERIKEDIKDIDSKYLELLDKIKVKNFRFKTRKDENFRGLEHVGVIAQEVLQALEDSGIDVNDQNIVDYREVYTDETDLIDNGKVYGVNYNQLATLLIPAYQKLKAEHESLKSELSDLKSLLKDKGVI